jgi:hypothetical protein
MTPPPVLCECYANSTSWGTTATPCSPSTARPSRSPAWPRGGRTGGPSAGRIPDGSTTRGSRRTSPSTPPSPPSSPARSGSSGGCSARLRPSRPGTARDHALRKDPGRAAAEANPLRKCCGSRPQALSVASDVRGVSGGPMTPRPGRSAQGAASRPRLRPCGKRAQVGSSFFVQRDIDSARRRAVQTARTRVTNQGLWYGPSLFGLIETKRETN